MTEFLKRSGRFFLLLLGVIFAAGFFHVWAGGYGFILFFLGLPALLVIFAVKSFIYILRGVKLSRELATPGRRIMVALAVPMMALATIALAVPALTGGDLSGSLSRLMLNRRNYEVIIANAKEGRSFPRQGSAYEEYGGTRYLVDPGPPVRVAFNAGEGFLDNWSAIIFDPSGEVMRADRLHPETGNFVAPVEITKLFGGDIVYCRHLSGDFYSCSFT